MTKKNHDFYTNWPRSRFTKLPLREWHQETKCEAVVIVPRKKKHDSGYLMMDFALVQDGVPTMRVGGCSDVINFDGTGGYGYHWTQSPTPSAPSPIPRLVLPSGWSIDCLPGSGLLHIFRCGAPKRGIIVGQAFSTMEIYANHKEEE